MDSLIRKNILGMEPYSPGKPVSEVQRELGLERVIKLASNENPLGPSPKAVKAVQGAANNLHIYPDGAAHNLRQAISTKFNIPTEQILLGNGSDELIHLLGLMYLANPNDELMMGDPGFSRYDASAHIADSQLVKVPLDENLVHDLPAMAKRATSNTKLIFIANPNNPTGTSVNKTDFEKFLKDLPETATVILDEAYAEYSAGVPDFPNSLDFIRKGENVIGLRTFSKAYGLAGIRIGYGFASASVVDAYHRIREPFNVNSLAQVAAIAALGDDEYIKQSVEMNTVGLKKLEEAFLKVGAKPIKSTANFILADMGEPAAPIFLALLQKGVIVRSGDKLGLPNYLRVSVGTLEEIEIFENALVEVCKVPAGVAR